MVGGCLNKCKVCTRRDVLEHRAENLERINAYDRERAKLPHRIAESRVRAKALKERHGKAFDRSHNAVTRALKSGALVRPAACERCPASSGIEAHHDDYSRPLDVMWLCPSCHSKRHCELKKLRAMAKVYGTQDSY